MNDPLDSRQVFFPMALTSVLLGLLGLLGFFTVGRGIMILPMTAFDVVITLMTGGLSGLALSLAQLPLIRNHVKSNVDWIFATTVGLSIGWILAALLGSLAMSIGARIFGVGGPMSMSVFGVTSGAILALFQSSVLNVRNSKKALSALVTFGAWTVGWHIFLPFPQIWNLNYPWADGLSSAIFGLILISLIYVGEKNIYSRQSLLD